MHFAREGYPWIFGLGSLSLVLGLLGFSFSGCVLLGLTLFIAFFFRDPDREIPDDTDAIVSPADGRVITVEPLARGKYAWSSLLLGLASSCLRSTCMSIAYR